MKAKYPWEIRDYTYQEWGKMDFDWNNKYKIDNTVESYLFRYNNYLKGLNNDYIMKSTFGIKNHSEIKKEINDWFDKSIGTYSTITYDLLTDK